MTATKVKAKNLVPPDGGWGWAVCLGCAIMLMLSVAPIACFGLLFQDKLMELGQATTGAALIYNVLNSISNFTGLFTGPVLHFFSYRQVAFCGCFLLSLGVSLCSVTNSFSAILFSYGVLGGLGFGFFMPITFLAVNAYFTTRRGKAVGLSLSCNAMGMMVWPMIIQYFLGEYGFQGAVLLVGGIGFNSLVGCMLLQPVEWHLKESPETENVEMGQTNKGGVVTKNQKLLHESNIRKFSTPLLQTKDVIKEVEDNGNGVFYEPEEKPKTEDCIQLKAKTDLASEVEIPLMPCREFRRESSNEKRRRSSVSLSLHTFDSTCSIPMAIAYAEKFQVNKEDLPKQKKTAKDILKEIYKSMDISLLADIRCLNILCGISLAIWADINFLLLYPMFLASLNFSGVNIALCMGIAAGTDIIARLTVPWFLDMLKWERRTGFLIGTICCIFGRTAMMMVTDFVPIVIITALSGYARGTTIVNASLTIAEFAGTNTEKLHAIYGLHMVLNGIVFLSMGPLVGFLRDTTNSYPICIYFMALVQLATAIAWTIEKIDDRCRKKQIVDGD